MKIGESSIIKPADVNTILKNLIKEGFTIIGFEIKKSRFDLTPIAVDDPSKLLDPIPLSQYFAYDFSRSNSSPKFLNTKLRGKKVALFARPCGTRALIELSKLNQVNLDDLFVISLDCAGRTSSKDVINALKKEKVDPETVDSESVTEDKIILKIKGKEKTLNIPRFENCNRCTKRMPTISDLSIDLVGDKVRLTVNSEKGQKVSDVVKGAADTLKDRVKFFEKLIKTAEKQRSKEIDEYLKLSDKDRFAKAIKLIEKCKLCGVCINSCPVCYCQAHGRCELQAKRKAKELNDPVLYWTTKMVHMSDTCVGCGRCTPVCPVNIPSAFFYDVMNTFVEEEFKYIAGKSKDDVLPRSKKAIVSEQS